jgi:dUTP pyrophosphatase
MRGFEKAKGYETMDFELPRRSTPHSAGYDLALIEDLTIPPQGIALGKTGLKAYMMDDEVLKVFPRSSLATKRRVTLPNNVGIIDKDYYGNPDNDGHILIALYNFSDTEVMLSAGERVAQGIFERYLVSPTEETPDAPRNGGFGSTGK